MATAFIGIFWFFVGFFLLLSLLFILYTGFLRLESRIGRTRDGYPPGKKVPTWSLPDSTGHIWRTPSKEHWQLLVFVNHTLAAFPGLLADIYELASTTEELEVIILAMLSKEFCDVMKHTLNLSIPIVPVNQNFYNRFNVRIMPFVFLVDPSGIVQWVGLVNNPGALVHIWHLLHNAQNVELSEVQR